ncbi:MAG: hypothetical protein Q8P99_02030 [bacterium]|nr:hypothetical protein [bacterium]
MIKDKLILTFFGLSGLMLLISGLVALVGLPSDAGDIIIRFDNYHNEVIWAGSLGLFFGVIGVMLVTVVLNLILVRHIYDKERFLAYLLSSGTLAVAFLFLVATLGIAFIN